MKGFKDKNKKFHPINNQKSVRKSRDQSAKNLGVRLKKDDSHKIIKSFVDLNAIGLDVSDAPIGSIIQGRGENYKIIAYSQGHTFSSKGIRHIDSSNIKDYRVLFRDDPEIEPFKIFAINNKLAKKMADSLFTGNFDIFRIKTEATQIT